MADTTTAGESGGVTDALPLLEGIRLIEAAAIIVRLESVRFGRRRIVWEPINAWTHSSRPSPCASASRRVTDGAAQTARSPSSATCGRAPEITRRRTAGSPTPYVRTSEKSASLHSPTRLKISSQTRAERYIPQSRSCSNAGRTRGIAPRSFARATTPIVPNVGTSIAAA